MANQLVAFCAKKGDDDITEILGSHFRRVSPWARRPWVRFLFKYFVNYCLSEVVSSCILFCTATYFLFRSVTIQKLTLFLSESLLFSFIYLLDSFQPSFISPGLASNWVCISLYFCFHSANSCFVSKFSHSLFLLLSTCHSVNNLAFSAFIAQFIDL